MKTLTKTYLIFSTLLLASCSNNDVAEESVKACQNQSECQSDSICINHFCVPRCEETGCTDGLICNISTGLCVTGKTAGETCSDEMPCMPGLTCSQGTCLASLTTCDNASNCPNDGLCINNICIDRCTQNSCKETEVCSGSGLCVTGGKQGDSCSTDAPCMRNLICESGTCRNIPCDDTHPCENDQLCNNGACLKKCDDKINPCKGNQACSAEGLCVDKCYSGSCQNGLVCDGKTRLCVVGECSWYDNCPTTEQYCDIENYRCVNKCNAGTCGEGLVCNDERRCVSGECTRTDPCKDPGKACDYETMTCTVKCQSNDDCSEGKLCYLDGVCRKPCSAGSCDTGTVCGDDGICIEAECSAIDPCDISYKVCFDGKCIDKCKSDKNCAEDQICNTTSGLCTARCNADSCGSGMVCGDDGRCTAGECSKLTPCAGSGKVCSASNECVAQTFDHNECYFYRCDYQCDCNARCKNAYNESDSDAVKQEKLNACNISCKKDCASCQKLNKTCPDGKQCNAFNQCIDSSTANGKGLGEPCSATKECAASLACIKNTVDNQGFCKPEAYLMDRQACASGSDKCVGNIIVECIDNTYSVQDCKTYYMDITAPTTGRFYGDEFSCVQLPNSVAVTCARICTPEEHGQERFVCGWDVDDNDIEMSDRYVCQTNAQGRTAYFPANNSTYCTPTCDPTTGKCEE